MPPPPPTPHIIFICREEDPDDVPHGHITSLVTYYGGGRIGNGELMGQLGGGGCGDSKADF